jgi:hypothetical protein
VLDDIAFRPVAEQPAGKDPAPFILGVIEDDELDKGAGFLRAFPLSSAFTGAQADDGAADADALPRL